MTSPAPPSTAEPSAAQHPESPSPSAPHQPLPGESAPTGAPPLDYATPWPRRKYVPTPEANRLFWQGVRKVVFAGGLGLLCYGLACLAAGNERHMAPVAVGWGVTFVVLMLPSPFGGVRHFSRRRTRRRRKRGRAPGIAPGDGAAPGGPSGI